MKKTMKSIICLLMAMMVAFSLGACKKSDSPEAVVASFVEKEGDAMIDVFKQSIEDSGMSCECTVEAQGTKIVIDCKIQGLNDIPDATKEMMQSAFDAQLSTMKAGFEDAKEELPELSGILINVLEEDGDFLADIDISF